MRTCDYCQVSGNTPGDFGVPAVQKAFCVPLVLKRGYRHRPSPRCTRRVILCPDCYLKKYGKPCAGAARSTFNKPAPGTPPAANRAKDQKFQRTLFASVR
jgi:hypothetical protein